MWVDAGTAASAPVPGRTCAPTRFGPASIEEHRSDESQTRPLVVGVDFGTTVGMLMSYRSEVGGLSRTLHISRQLDDSDGILAARFDAGWHGSTTRPGAETRHICVAAPARDQRLTPPALRRTSRSSVGWA